MKRASSSPVPFLVGRRGRRVHRPALLIGTAALLLAACGGDDDDAEATTTTTTLAAATTTIAVTTTLPVATTTTTTLPEVVDYVTEGATVVVANSSGVNGAAGRMTDRLGVVGYSTGPATNGSEGQLAVTKIYFDPTNSSAQAVAESLRLAFGGGDIQLFEMGVPAPVESGDIGDASVVVSMGNDIADKSLEELQGLVAPTVDDSGGDTTDAPDS